MIVYARGTASVGWKDGLVRLSEGDAWWADDPFVRAHPTFFIERPPKVHGTEPRVEQATAAPGEKRTKK